MKIYVLLLGKLWEVRELSLHLLLLTCLQLQVIFMPKGHILGCHTYFAPLHSLVSSLVWWTDHSWIRVSVSNTQFPRSYISIKYHFSPCLPSTCEVRVLNSDIKNVVQLNFIVLDLASYSCLFEISLGFDSVTHHRNYYCTSPPTCKMVPSLRAGDVEVTQVGCFLMERLHPLMSLRFILFHSDFLSLINLCIY